MYLCNINIIKNDGSKVPLDIEKINRMVEGACKDIEDVSASEIIMHSKLQFVDGMTTKRIQEILIKSAKDLVSADKPNYSAPAARLQMVALRKAVYGQYEPPKFSDIYKKNVKSGRYDKEVLKLYSKKEWNFFDNLINHKRDKDFRLAAVGQLLDKYLVQDRTTGEHFETPQVMYMGIAITLLSYISDKKQRLEAITRFYNGASTFSFSLPTPIMSGVRTPTRQFSSCVLIKSGDSLGSINATAEAVVNYVSKRAGIGLDHSAIRGIGSPIRGGEMRHTGLIPFMKYHTAALKSCSQGL